VILRDACDRRGGASQQPLSMLGVSFKFDMSALALNPSQPDVSWSVELCKGAANATP